MASSSMKSFLKSREKFFFMSKAYVPSECGQFIEEKVFKPYEKIETTCEKVAANMQKQYGGDINEWRDVIYDHAQKELERLINQPQEDQTGG